MKKPQTLLLMILFGVLMFPTLAFADGATSAMPSAVSRLLEAVLQLGMAVTAVLTPVLVAWAAAWVKRRTGLNVQDQLNGLVTHAVGYAEEQAHKALTNHQTILTGPKKLEAAMDFALDFAEQHKLPQWARDRLVKLIEAELGKWRPMQKATDAAAALPAAQSAT